MNKNITQDIQNDNQVSKTIRNFLPDSMFERNRSKKQNFSQKYMIMQNVLTNTSFGYLRQAGLMEVLFSRSAICFFPSKIRRSKSRKKLS